MNASNSAGVALRPTSFQEGFEKLVMIIIYVK